MAANVQRGCYRSRINTWCNKFPNHVGFIYAYVCCARGSYVV